MKGTELERKIARGTLVNFLGVVAKLLTPVYFIVITRLYGPAVVGVYLLANTIMEMSINFTFSGFRDGILLYTSRHVGIRSEHGIIYRVIVNAMVVILGLTFLAVLIAWIVGPQLLDMWFDRHGLSDAVRIMVTALPFLAIPQMTVAATKAKMIMKYDVILIGVLRPGLLTILAALMYFVRGDIIGVALAYLLSNLMVTAVALFIFARHFSFSGLFARVRDFRFYRPLLTFSLPQNLNMTFVYFTSGVSVLMLGSHDISKALIAFFGTGAEVVRQVKQVRLAFSTAFTPVISRLHRQDRMNELEGHYCRVTRWVVSIVFPVLFVGLAFKEQILLLFHESYTYDSSFMIMLAVGTFAGCAFGLANNMVVMTGHSLMNLINSFFVSGAAFLFNWLFIPRWGLLGAAAATSLAMVANVSITTVEIYLLYGIRLRVVEVYRPFVAGIVAAGGFFAAGQLPFTGIVGSLVTASVSLSVFGLTMLLLGLHEADKNLLLSFIGAGGEDDA